jgi:7,8-dihydropterin-6-yl-methyl-4-(beta-D-ribofuranosyl)aminobenzene 5'-phosphate synthase
MSSILLLLLVAQVQAPEVEALEIVSVVDNYFDGLQKEEPYAKRVQLPKVNFDGIRLQAEHGLAYYIEATVAGKKHKILLDFSLSRAVYLHNLKKLGLNIRDAEALVLTHGHQDHYDGVWDALKQVKKKTPFYVGNEEVFAPRLINDLDLGTLERAKLEKQGAKVVLASEPTVVAESAIASGVIPRVTEYEKPPPAMKMKVGGQVVQDTFSHELALFFKVKDKGLVVITSCAHAGVVNTVLHAKKVTGESRVLAILGGMHLTTSTDEVIAKTVGDLKAAKPTYVAPMHCTGNRAVVKLSVEMPAAYVHPSVGTRFVF